MYVHVISSIAQIFVCLEIRLKGEGRGKASCVLLLKFMRRPSLYNSYVHSVKRCYPKGSEFDL